MWKALEEMGIPDHLACLLRNMYVGQEARIALCMEQLIGSRLRKKYDRAVCCYQLFNLYTEHMRNAGLDELQAGIKICGRNVNNLRYADDTTLMGESKELMNLFFLSFFKLNLFILIGV